MIEQVTGDSSTDAVVVSEAFATARELLQRAEAEAARLRADADRYVRQREQEAELLVAKARRLLAVAEERAAAVGADPVPVTLDLDEVAAAGTAPPTPGSRHVRNDLDRMLAEAIAKAVDRSFLFEP